MPELPEVEIVKQSLNKKIRGKIIQKVSVKNRNLRFKLANNFEKNSMNKIGLIDEIAPRYRSTYFAHIFSGGYSSGYYSYVHAAVLDSDAFEAFEEAGDVFDPDLSSKLRSSIYSMGATEEAMDLFLEFRGRKPIIEPLLKVRGLDGSE